MVTREKWYAFEFKNISSSIQSKESLDLFDFLRIRNFKLNNFSTENNEHILEITKKAFEVSQYDVKEALHLLMKLNGVGLPVASAMLAMKFPDKFAIIDKNVILALKEEGQIDETICQFWKNNYKKKNADIYPEFLEKVKACKQSADKDLRDTEFRLFKQGRKHSDVKRFQELKHQNNADSANGHNQ